MPRRRALTEAQLETLLALPTTEADLIRHWTLDGADLVAVDWRRGGHNQLGYALQLCTFRYPGRLLRPGETIPEPALHFIAEQVHVGADALAAYAARRQIRQEQLDDRREAFGFRIAASLDDVGVVREVCPETEYGQQAVQVGQRRNLDPGGADLHALTSSRVQHPGRDHRDHARRHLDVNHVTASTALTVVPAQPAPVQRMPPVVNKDLLPNMGRMIPGWHRPGLPDHPISLIVRLGKTRSRNLCEVDMPAGPMNPSACATDAR